jgi:ABC-type bacteriocin/lantibiotic exporter with double-glycine peptidase domain
MKLIPQTQQWGCWYASAQMLINWKQEKRGQSVANLIPPEFDAESRKIRDANSGIENPEILRMAKRLGLRAVPPQSFTSENILACLQKYGPLWANGEEHIVVIAGITDSVMFGDMLYVYDPFPINVGKISWMRISVFNRALDSTKESTVSLLYCPDDI